MNRRDKEARSYALQCLFGVVVLLGAAGLMGGLPGWLRGLLAATAAYLAAAGVLVLLRVRGAAEVLAALLLFLGAWGAYDLIARGFTPVRLALIGVAAFWLLFAYPDLRRVVRGGPD